MSRHVLYIFSGDYATVIDVRCFNVNSNMLGDALNKNYVVNTNETGMSKTAPIPKL